MNSKEQFITNTLKGYFLDRNTVSVDDEGNCMYRGDNGCKCAVGQHIPNYKYRTAIEGRAAYAIGVNLPLKRGSDGESYRVQLDDLLSSEAKKVDLSEDTWSNMQRVHDTIARLGRGSKTMSIQRIENALFEIEKENHIKLPVLRELLETTIAEAEEA